MPSTDRYCEIRQGCVTAVHDLVSTFQCWCGSGQFGVPRPWCSRAQAIHNGRVWVDTKKIAPSVSRGAVIGSKRVTCSQTRRAPGRSYVRSRPKS